MTSSGCPRTSMESPRRAGWAPLSVTGCILTRSRPDPVSPGSRQEGTCDECSDGFARCGGYRAAGSGRIGGTDPGGRSVVDHADQGSDDLRDPAAADPVRHLVRTPGCRPYAAPARSQLERPVRTAAVTGRRAEAALQRGHHPGQGRQGGLHPGPGVRRDTRVPDLLDHPGRRRGQHVRRTDRAATDRPAGGCAGRAGTGFHRGLRNRARRLGLRIHVPAARRSAFSGADDLLRRRHGPVVRRGLPLLRDALHLGDRQPAGVRLVHLAAPGVVHRLLRVNGRRDQPGALRSRRGRG